MTVVCALLAGAIGGLWLRIIGIYSGAMVRISMAMTCAILVFVALVAVFNGNPAGALVPLGILALTGLYFYLVRHRIPFAQAILSLASDATQAQYGVLVIAYVMAFAGVGSCCCSGYGSAPMSHFLPRDVVGFRSAG